MAKVRNNEQRKQFARARKLADHVALIRFLRFFSGEDYIFSHNTRENIEQSSKAKVRYISYEWIAIHMYNCVYMEEIPCMHYGQTEMAAIMPTRA